jgi:DNA mismatch repair protein MSH6
MRKRTHPDYDPSTIYISPADFGRLTETKKEYWKIKKNNFDTVVFYQQGDFFNMFGPDADISVRDFGFVYNANLDSVGFNRKQLGEWTKKFVHAGYKVMVVEQTSTATTDEDKKKKQMMKKKTEDRAVGYRVTPGTMRDFDMLDQFSTAAQFVMAVHEEVRSYFHVGCSFRILELI